MKTKTINILLLIAMTVLFAFVLSACHLIDDHSDDRAQADNLQDAIKTAKARANFVKAASDICGINAGWIEQADGRIRCALHNGRRTSKTAMVVMP